MLEYQVFIVRDSKSALNKKVIKKRESFELFWNERLLCTEYSVYRKTRRLDALEDTLRAAHNRWNKSNRRRRARDYLAGAISALNESQVWQLRERSTPALARNSGLYCG